MTLEEKTSLLPKNGWVKFSLKRQLVTSSVIFWIVAVSVVSLAFLGFGQSYMLQETSQRNTQIASIIGRDLNAQVAEILADARNFTRHLELLNPDLSGQVGAAVSLRLSAPQRYRSIYFYDSQGVLRFYINDSVDNLFRLTSAEILARPAVPVNDSVLDAYRSSRTQGTFLSEVAFSPIENIPVMHLGLPLNPALGTVVLEIDLQGIWGGIQQITFGQTGFVYLVSRSGEIIAHREPAMIGRPLPEEISVLIAGNEGFVEYTEAESGQVVLSAFSPVGGLTGWGVIVQQSEADAHAPIDRMAATIVALWVAMGVIGTAAIFRAVSNLTSPIVKLTEATNSIAATGKLARISASDRTDELGQLSRSFDRMIERLQATEGKLEHAAAEERNRLARDLHDAVSQTLFSTCIIAEVLPKLWAKNPEEGRRRLDEIQRLTRGALAEMRTLLFELRPQVLADADMSYLLRQLVESFNTRQPTPVDLQVSEECQMTPEVKVAFYRVAQEALNNIAKHAQANHIIIQMRCEGGSAVLSVGDDGLGFDRSATRPESLGLGIMRDRARDIGADLEVKSEIGRGTVVNLKWRLPAGEEIHGGD
ncbi:histidine kinase [Dehalogenimonas alkenigignens]|uniref:Signal transduction histidine kinase n=1 Tax=Dehalogenimonas alkenigignens TaxID=1217799 RepID=A0A0W0GG20_9CHLR|nr:histidine kinase [Dehalogenimonas alkenigignens]KTB47513.1 Signal transduction histidine kinase [Dehalogenimonas alkenigignens]PVV83430.1 HAMP domain-containing protein [Dehalogenimonas alkenigignens]